MIKIITEPTVKGGQEEGVVAMPRRGKADEMFIERSNAMMRKNLRQTDVAKRWRRSQAFVSQLLRGKVRSDEFEAKFAKLVGVPRYKLFPPSNGVGRPPWKDSKPVPKRKRKPARKPAAKRQRTAKRRR